MKFHDVKKFFQWTKHKCIKVFKNWSTSFTVQRRKYSVYASSISLAQIRGSVSTEVTILDQDLGCANSEIEENKLNESKERKCSY